MAEGNEPQPFVPLSGTKITVASASSKVSIISQMVHQYGKVVTVSIRFSVTSNLENTESFINGLPRPLNGDRYTIVSKMGGAGNFNTILTASGSIRNDWDGIASSTYTINYAYIAE